MISELISDEFRIYQPGHNWIPLQDMQSLHGAHLAIQLNHSWGLHPSTIKMIQYWVEVFNIRRPQSSCSMTWINVNVTTTGYS